MNSIDSLLYGLVQGLTEYLPVSSSAHLVILPKLLGQEDPGLAFDVFLHLGTLFAITIYFFKDWLEILKNPLPPKTGPVKSLSWVHLIIGTIPAVIVGVGLNHWVQEHTRAIQIQAVTSAVFGILLWAVDRFQKQSRPILEASYKDMLLIGCAQALALVPGVSRSGSTITAARGLGFNRESSLRISFLLSMPVTLGAIVFEGRHWHELVESVSGVWPLLIAGSAAMVFGAFAIQLMMKWMVKVSFAYFAIYRVAFGIAILLFLK